MMQKLWLLSFLCLVWVGCNSSKSPDAASETTPPAPDANLPSVVGTTQADMVNASFSTDQPPEAPQEPGPNDRLLDSRLPEEKLKEGWIRLYDGHEMAGWFYIGTANWSFADGVITVDGGDSSLLCTNFQVSDFELLVDFKCSEKTESGIFLRSSADPRDVSRDCYALSIAPGSSAYPTGSLIKRQKTDSNLQVDPDQWHTYRIVVQGDQVNAWLDGQAVLEYRDSRKLPRGYIGLQHNLGVVRFRNILMRPLGGQTLVLGEGWQADWKTLENAGPNFKAEPSQAGLRLTGGPGQLESKQQWDDFVLQATYQVANPQVDSGILFRGLPDRYSEAYECQIFDGPLPISSDNKPAKLQTGSLNIPIKGEPTNARVLASQPGQPTYVTIIADEGQFTTFVNGLLVADAADTREVSPNPRAGFRREPGRLGLQAHDENCDVLFQELKISPINKR